MSLRRSLIVVALAALPAPVLAGPRDDLLQLVPDDYTFCVVVHNLRDHGTRGDKRSFLPALTDAPLFKLVMQTPEAQQVQQVVDTILKELDITPAQLRDDLLGDALVFAYRKGPPGKPELEDGLILLHARDDKLLARVVERINQLQIQGGELKAVEAIDSKSGRYFRRVKAATGEPADYYALQGHRLIFSGREALLKSTLPSLANEARQQGPIVARLKQLGVDTAPVACLVNPRGFDADLRDMAKAGRGSEQTFLRQFAGYWQAVDGLAFALQFKPALEISLALNVRKEQLPKSAQVLFTEAGKRSPLWECVPEDALIAAVGRIQLEALVDTLSSFLTAEDRKKALDSIGDALRPFLESDDLAPLMRGLGPDVGSWLMAPSAGDHSWCPQGILAVRVAPGPDGVKAQQAALNGLDFLARLACLSNKELRVRSENQGDILVRSLASASAFPAGFQPAFAAKGGYLVVADSPRTIASFVAPKGSASDAAEVPIVRISATACRAYLSKHRGDISKFVASLNKNETRNLNAQLETLVAALDGLERIELVQRSAPGRVTFALRLIETQK